MAKDSYSNEDLIDIIDNEGLDYTILYYLNVNDIEDPTLRKLFKQAKDALEQIQEILGID